MAITKVDLANVVTGVLPVANGGTGGSSYTATQWTTTGSDIYYNTGNVGIGTSSPAQKLDVNGTVNFGNINTGNGVSTGTAALELGSLRTGDGVSLIDFHSVSGTDYEARIIRIGGVNGALQILNTGTGDFRLQASGAAPMIFDTSATERMRIDSSGNVGIGSSETSIFTGVAGTGKLVVTGNNSATDPANNQDSCIVIANTNDTTNNTAALHFAWQDTDNTPNFASASIVGILGTKVANQYAAGQLAFLTSSATNNAPSEKMRISAAGGLSVGTTADPGAGAIYATGNITAYYSDDRLKTKLGGIENALDKVKSLSGFYYEANQTAQDLGYQPVREVGVSAQQVQAVLPEVVKPAPIDQQYLTVDYERLVPLLIEAIKELEEKVAKLEAK